MGNTSCFRSNTPQPARLGALHPASEWPGKQGTPHNSCRKRTNEPSRLLPQNERLHLESQHESCQFSGGRKDSARGPKGVVSWAGVWLLSI